LIDILDWDCRLQKEGNFLKSEIANPKSAMPPLIVQFFKTASPPQSHNNFLYDWFSLNMNAADSPKGNSVFACKYRGKNGSGKKIKCADFEGIIPIS